MAEEKKWVRPYWHVDAKWFFGLFFTAFLTVSLLLFTLSVLTSEKIAINLATYLVANQFSREGLDDPKGVEEFRQKASQTGQEVFYPFGDESVSITREELDNLSPKELRLKVFKQVVEPIYYQKRTPEAASQYGILAYFNLETHNQIRRFFGLSLVPLVISLAGLVGFSYRYGRLISPAVPLLLTSLPISFFLYLIQHTTPPKGDDGPLSAFPREVVLQVAKALSPPFYLATLSAFTLIFAAIVIKTLSRFRKVSS